MSDPAAWIETLAPKSLEDGRPVGDPCYSKSGFVSWWSNKVEEVTFSSFQVGLFNEAGNSARQLIYHNHSFIAPIDSLRFPVLLPTLCQYKSAKTRGNTYSAVIFLGGLSFL